MEDSKCREFQEIVRDHLVRHRSILDVLSKMQESNARVTRAVTKSVTSCGCLQINAGRQQVSPETTYSDFKTSMSSHLQGQICETCQEHLESELGRAVFYLTAVCELLGMDLEEILEDEKSRIKTLGLFSLT